LELQQQYEHPAVLVLALVPQQITAAKALMLAGALVVTQARAEEVLGQPLEMVLQVQAGAVAVALLEKVTV
jgi:hypothetical protein